MISILNNPRAFIQVGRQKLVAEDIPLDQLQAIIDFLHSESIDIRSQIEVTALSVSDIKWISKAKKALRKKNQQRVQLINRLAELKKDEKEKARILNPETLSEIFLGLASKHMPENMFFTLMESAHEMQQKGIDSLSIAQADCNREIQQDWSAA